MGVSAKQAEAVQVQRWTCPCWSYAGCGLQPGRPHRSRARVKNRKGWAPCPCPLFVRGKSALRSRVTFEKIGMPIRAVRRVGWGGGEWGGVTKLGLVWQTQSQRGRWRGRIAVVQGGGGGAARVQSQCNEMPQSPKRFILGCHLFGMCVVSLHTNNSPVQTTSGAVSATVGAFVVCVHGWGGLACKAKQQDGC